MLPYLVSLAVIAVAWIYLSTYRRRPPPAGFKQVPDVPGKLPFVGNGIAFSKDIIGYVRSSYKQVGPVFRMKVFNKHMTIICDNNPALKKEFFAATEEKMSLYDVLASLYFADAFSDDPRDLSHIINLIKSTVSVRFDEFMPKIMLEAKTMLKRMKQKYDGKIISLDQEMIRFVARTSARCFIGIDLSDEFFDTLMEFTELLNKIVVATYFVPQRLLRLIANPFLSPHRKKMTKQMRMRYPLLTKNGLLTQKIIIFMLNQKKRKKSNNLAIPEKKDMNMLRGTGGLILSREKMVNAPIILVLTGLKIVNGFQPIFVI